MVDVDALHSAVRAASERKRAARAAFEKAQTELIDADEAYHHAWTEWFIAQQRAATNGNEAP